MGIDEKLKKLQEIAEKLDNNEVTFEERLKVYMKKLTKQKVKLQF